MSFIPYGRQSISDDDIQAVVDVLKSDYLTQGPTVPAFEQSVNDYCGSKYAVAVNSATSALHIACLALGASEGDLVWTSPITFVASANCALFCGATVDFIDIDPRTYNISVNHLEKKLSAAKKTGKLPKIVIPIHFSGQSCEMEKIHQLSKEYGFSIIEDASHAIGGKYKNEPIGNCRFSDNTVFSFHPVKIITTAEGGMALTNCQSLANKLALLRNHGITRDPKLMTHKPDGGWYYQQIDLGFNYRMTDIQAALGISQMQRIDEFVKTRRKIAERYDNLLVDLPITIPWQHPDSHSSRHLYIVRLKLDQINKSHREIFENLKEKGIGVNLHYIPVHTQPYYMKMGFKVGDFVEAERYYQEAISIPIFPGLKEETQDQVIEAITRSIK